MIEVFIFFCRRLREFSIGYNLGRVPILVIRKESCWFCSWKGKFNVGVKLRGKDYVCFQSIISQGWSKTFVKSEKKIKEFNLECSLDQYEQSQKKWELLAEPSMYCQENFWCKQKVLFNVTMFSQWISFIWKFRNVYIRIEERFFFYFERWNLGQNGRKNFL